MTESENKLFEENMRLVGWVVTNKLGIRPSDNIFDDMMQEGYIALMKACSAYNSDESKFTTYAAKVIYRACVRFKVQFVDKVNSQSRSAIYKKWLVAYNEGQSLDEFCKANHVRKSTILGILSIANTVDLDAPIPGESGDDSMSMHEIIEDPSTLIDVPYADAISFEEIHQAAMEVSYKIGQSACRRGVWIDWILAMEYCALEGISRLDIIETKGEYYAKKYSVSKQYVSNILVEGTNELKKQLDDIRNGVHDDH